jgi:hypothetical protein
MTIHCSVYRLCSPVPIFCLLASCIALHAAVPFTLWCFSIVAIKVVEIDSITAAVLLHKLRTCALCVMIFQLVPNAAPVLMLVYNERAPEFAAMHYSGMCLVVVALAVLTHQIMTPLIMKLEKATRNSGQIKAQMKSNTTTGRLR